MHLSFVFLGFSLPVSSKVLGDVIACDSCCWFLTSIHPWIQVSTLLLSSCDDLLIVDEGCVVDINACVALCCFVTGVHP